MKREGAIGVAGVLALAAVVGISVQPGPKPAETSQAVRSAELQRSKSSLPKPNQPKVAPGCSNLEEELEAYLGTDKLAIPKACYESADGESESRADLPSEEAREQLREKLNSKTSGLKFVIALMPDPVHTHAASLFDQFAAAVQQAAQDEKYDFDSAWLPWEDDESSYALLEDEKKANRDRHKKEDQPGIILFRRTLECPEAELKKEEAGCKEGLENGYRNGLIVFVVGEEATQGIHKQQFYNALEWIAALRPRTDNPWERLAILGPTFSGSLPSVAAVLTEQRGFDLETKQPVSLLDIRKDQRLAIYSGSVSSNLSATVFQKTFGDRIVFHSFVQNDDEILRRFCNYMMTEQPGFDAGKLAILSEDETAYGGSGVNPGGEAGKDHAACPDRALRLYFPRDISALRGAYQTKSLFDAGTSSQTADTQRRNLPSDLADPAGRVHDSIRSYGGNQTPLAQEAYLMEIVAALRELHARYIVLRSSNTLDQMFLTNFLRRSYPNGRIVIFGSDLMFIRERGSTGLSGVMTLSTYPLFPLERDWTEHQSLTAADRTFSGDNPEGTYIALRLLLNEKSTYTGATGRNRCYVLEKGGESQIFVPKVSCTADSLNLEPARPIPDYSPPFWTLANQCGELKYPNRDEACSCPSTANTGDLCPYPGPATWLSVVGVNRFWPLAAMTSETPKPDITDNRTERCGTDRGTEPGGRPEVPLGMKVFWMILLGFALFHTWCCCSGSFMAGPTFLAHFASTKDRRHTVLVFSGSCCIAFMAMVAAWGSGVFWNPTAGLAYPRFALWVGIVVCLLAWAAIFGNLFRAWRLSEDLPTRLHLPKMTDELFRRWSFRASLLFALGLCLFYLSFIDPIESILLAENRVLTYWRSMHLWSGVSPIVPMFAVLAGLYLSFWYTLHGLALFGPDRPRLPRRRDLLLTDGPGGTKEYLRMFSHEDAGRRIEKATQPLSMKVTLYGGLLFLLSLAGTHILAGGVPVRSLAAERYSFIFVVFLDLCCTISIVDACRLCKAWEELRRLLDFMDRIPLRRTLAAMREFSWGSVWKMSGNVLEVRYKVISRQMECMNHTITSLQEYLKKPASLEWNQAGEKALESLRRMQTAGLLFKDWYCKHYKLRTAGNLQSFRDFQKSIAEASGIVFAELLVPAWREEKVSLVVAPIKAADEKEQGSSAKPPQAKDELVRNAEEFVCLTYLGFIQNILGRMRTMALTVMAMLLAATVATSTYPFDPRQSLSIILIVLFAITGAMIVKVYAEMHRDTTLSYMTNTNPGEVGMEFWLKLLGFGFAPLIGLLTRIFPGIADSVFSWLQPGVSALK